MKREIAISVDEGLLADVDAIAEKEIRSRSNMISIFITDGITKFRKAEKRKSRRLARKVK